MICEQGVEGALPPLGDAVPKPLLVFLMTDLGSLYRRDLVVPSLPKTWGAIFIALLATVACYFFDVHFLTHSSLDSKR
jgi:hypothetical protein